MPQWDKCDPIEVSIVPGECGPSSVPSEEGCGDPPAEVSVSIVVDIGFAPPNPPRPLGISTSLYPLVVDEDFTASGEFLSHSSFVSPLEIYSVNNSEVLGGVLDTILVRYDHAPQEEYEVYVAEFLSGVVNIVATYRTYDKGPDDYRVDMAQILGGALLIEANYIAYTNWPEESFATSNASVLSGELL